jgi:predicted flap endonuclease-1-like 5' DNA nuclease
MQIRFANARFIAVLIIVIGGIGLIAWFLRNQAGDGVFGFIPQQVLILSILWIIVGILLLLFIRQGDEPSVDVNAVNRLETQVKNFDSRFKDMDARLEARVGDVDNRFSRRVGDYDGKLGAFDTRLTALESTPKAEPRVMGFSGATEVFQTPDDLKIIEGIGPKMEAALHAAGITTFAQLASASEDQLRDAVEGAGMSFAPSIPTWARQAQYLVDGDKAGFDAYVAKLIAGRG